jgi:hypothetical protein
MQANVSIQKDNKYTINMYEYPLNIMLYTPVHTHAARDTHKKAQEPLLYLREVQSVVSHEGRCKR